MNFKVFDMKLYGLFEYSYDYYQFEKLHVVSYDRANLKNHLYGFSRFAETEDIHKLYKKSKDNHFMIKELEVI